MITKDNIIRIRLNNQLLNDAHIESAAQVVDTLVAVQAQDYYGATWAISQRISHPVVFAKIEDDFNKGAFLRTHLLRPTWHFVSPKDIRWMLALTGPRVHAQNAFMYRKSELDRPIFNKANQVIIHALENEEFLTRAQLGSVLEQSGIDTHTGQRLTYLIMAAELDGIICSGPRQAKQFTYALLDKRVPEKETLSYDDALVELSTRYFATRGPATIQDFSKWSGLNLSECRKGHEAIKANLTCEIFEQSEYWYRRSDHNAHEATAQARLVSIYDEFFSSYKNQLAAGSADKTKFLKSLGNALTSVVLVDGQIAGTWKREMGKDSVAIRTMLLNEPDELQKSMIYSAALKFGRFIEKEIRLQVEQFEILKS